MSICIKSEHYSQVEQSNIHSACWDLFQIFYRLWKLLNCILFEDCCLTSRTQVAWLIWNLLYYENYIVLMFWAEGQFLFLKNSTWWPMHIFAGRVTLWYIRDFFICISLFNLVCRGWLKCLLKHLKPIMCSLFHYFSFGWKSCVWEFVWAIISFSFDLLCREIILYSLSYSGFVRYRLWFLIFLVCVFLCWILSSPILC